MIQRRLYSYSFPCRTTITTTTTTTTRHHSVRSSRWFPRSTSSSTLSCFSSLSRRIMQHNASHQQHHRTAALFSSSAVPEEEEEEEEEYDDSTTTHQQHEQQHYPHLFQPLDLSRRGVNMILPNRVLMGSMHTGLEGNSLPKFLVPALGYMSGINNNNNTLSNESHNTLDRMAQYFHERALGGVGLMVTGGVAPNQAGWVSPFSGQLTNHQEMLQHRIVTDAVHDVQIPIVKQQKTYGDSHSSNSSDGATTYPDSVQARICLQILHSGRYGYHPFVVSASKTKSPISPFKAHALTKSEIAQTIQDYVRCSVLAAEAGYDGIEIMGSEGYLLSQFLTPKTNLRTDEYGGSFENRIRFPIEIVKAIRQAIGHKDFILIFRLSLLDLVNDGMLFNESIELAKRLHKEGITIINTGIGWHEARIPTIATSVPRGSFAFTTTKLRQALLEEEEEEENSSSQKNDLPILVSTNRFNHPKTIDDYLRTSGVDMVSMARPLLADPDFLLKSQHGRHDDINTCIACNQACLDHAFIGKTASCLVNPRACHETELLNLNKTPLLEPNERLHIGVIGGGLAGCSFALTAAQRGHTITLYETSNEIGGQFHMAKLIPGKEEFYETIRYYNNQLMKHPRIQIQYNKTITHNDMIENKNQYDKWIVATGVNPRNPNIPGQNHSPNVLSYIDVLLHQKHVGKNVAIIGAGGIGFDVAEYLLHDHNQNHSNNNNKSHADNVSHEDFWKQWGIDPNMKHRGGLVINNDNDEDSLSSSSSSSPSPTTKRNIVMLQRKKGKVGKNLGRTTGWIHRATLQQSGRVEMIDGVQEYKCIDENGYLHIVTKHGKQRVLKVDNIILCAGQVERNELHKQAIQLQKQQKQQQQGNGEDDCDDKDDDDDDHLADRVYTIGGANYAGELDAKRAIDHGTRLAMSIHDHENIKPGKHIHIHKMGIEEQMYHVLKRFT